MLCEFGGDSDSLRQLTNNNSQRAEESFSCIQQSPIVHIVHIQLQFSQMFIKSNCTTNVVLCNQTNVPIVEGTKVLFVELRYYTGLAFIC